MNKFIKKVRLVEDVVGLLIKNIIVQCCFLLVLCR